jgi:hypothetical protein
MTSARPTLACVVALAVACIPLAAQQPDRPDIIRGRVIGPDSQPVAGVRVTVRAAAGGDTRETVTNARGTYTVLFPAVAGEYLVTARFIGLAPATVRVVRAGDEAVLTANVMLAIARGVTRALEKVTVTERPRSRPSRSDDQPFGELSHDAGAAGDIREPRDAWRNPLDPRRYSVLGADPSENTLTVNGALVQTVLPNPVGLNGRLSTASADASQGGYSGGRLAVVMNAGGDYHLRYLDLAAAPASLQWVDGPSAQTGAQSTTLTASLWTFDPLLAGRVHQNSTLTYTQRTSPLPEFPTSPAGLARLGLAPDSLARFLGLMSQVGIPSTVSAGPGHQRTTSAAWMSRLDVGRSANTTFNVVMNAGTAGTAGAYMTPSALASHGGSSRETGGFVTATLSRYVGNGFLTDVSTTLNAHTNRTDPYLALPEGRVRVLSALSTGDSALTWLTFGGNPTAATRDGTTTWQAHASTKWISFDGKHQFHVGGDLYTERLSADRPNNPLGIFEFESLEALGVGRAMRFTRETQTSEERALGTRAGFYLDNRWTARPRLSIQYGMRLDVNRLAAPIPYNAAVDTLFGRRTDVLPRLAQLSPRLGLQWRYERMDPPGRLPSDISISTGRYQQSLGAVAALAASQATGLPSATRVLDCVGDAVPAATWASYQTDQATIPGTCVDGSGGTPVTSTVPRVQFYDPMYQPPVRWLTAITWNSRAWTEFQVALLHSRGTARRSVIDDNLRTTPTFTLPDEGARPVYAPVGAIVPATGATALADSRRVNRYGPVLETLSDLRSSATELVVSKGFWIGQPLSLSTQYRYQTGREQARGFDSPSAGDPFAVSWSRSSLPRHAVGLNLRARFSERYVLTARSWLDSGSPYTPLVAGDVNGDGTSNDIAFIPASATALGQEMAASLRDASASARNCLNGQYGQIAARNSCTGPWSGGLDLQLELSAPGLPSEAGIVIDVVNAAGAVDRLLHGTAGARGWGDPAVVDSRLLVVNGFDPASRQFQYQVNPRFGQRGDLGAWHQPIEIRIRVSTPIGPSLTTQQNRKMARAVRTSGREVGRALPFYNPFAALRQLEEKLYLTAVQVDSLGAMEGRWRQAVDSTQATLADYAEQVSETIPDQDIVMRVREAIERVTTTTKAWAPAIHALLTENQIVLLPPGLHAWMTRHEGGGVGPVF